MKNPKNLSCAAKLALRDIEPAGIPSRKAARSCPIGAAAALSNGPRRKLADVAKLKSGAMSVGKRLPNER